MKTRGRARPVRLPPRIEDLSPNVTLATLHVLRSAVPLLMRNSVLPGVTFLTGSLLVNIEVGALLAFSVAAGMLIMDRRAGRAGFVSALVMSVAFVSATVSVISRGLEAYFLPTAGVDLILCIGCLVSLVVGRPFAAKAPGDFFRMSPEVRASPEFAGTARYLTWFMCFFYLGKGSYRVLAFVFLPTTGFITAVIIGEMVGILVLTGFSTMVSIVRLGDLARTGSPAHTG